MTKILLMLLPTALKLLGDGILPIIIARIGEYLQKRQVKAEVIKAYAIVAKEVLVQENPSLKIREDILAQLKAMGIES